MQNCCFRAIYKLNRPVAQQNIAQAAIIIIVNDDELMMSNPLLRDIPLQWETQRLLIRCPQPGDGAIVHAATVESPLHSQACAA
jgi:hypothetical protein